MNFEAFSILVDPPLGHNQDIEEDEDGLGPKANQGFEIISPKELGIVTN